jgi:hypothetical protein
MQRIRTTKERARRIDLMYFSRPHWLRQWRFWLSCAIPVLALGWLFTVHAQGGQKAFSSGPLSRSHAVFTQQCALCHLRQSGSYFQSVADKACLSCHDAPLHQASQTFTPACSSCHVEHKGAQRLAATADSVCTQCHSDLHSIKGNLQFARSINGFGSGHPEFAAVREGARDPGGIKLNHYLHLQANLIGPNHTRVQLTCDDCHRSANAVTVVSAIDKDAWPYAGTQLQTVFTTQEAGKLRPPRASAYMAPPKFGENCARCHLLDFDKRFSKEQVPHDKPEVVHAFLGKRFSEYIAGHPGDVHEAVLFDRQLPEKPPVIRIARDAREWVQFRVEEAEDLLWRKTCKECHTLNPTSGPLPEVAKSNITARWMPHAEFSHDSHRMMTCESCHTKATLSHETADVLLPSIQTCQECHRAQGPAKEFAEGRCFECHQYHNWKNEQRVKGTYDLHQLRSETAVGPPRS